MVFCDREGDGVEDEFRLDDLLLPLVVVLPVICKLTLTGIPIEIPSSSGVRNVHVA